MKPLFTAEQSRQIDHLLIEQGVASGYELMSRAAQSCFRVLREHWPQAESVVIVTGSGNNGGDGYALGKLLLDAQISVVVYETSSDLSSTDALRARQSYVQAKGNLKPVSEFSDLGAEVVVDALLGTGLKRDLSEPMTTLIGQINQSETPVLSVDIPSGLNADSGVAQPCAVQAVLTVTLIVRKQGMFTAQAMDYCGNLTYDDLDLDSKHLSSFTPSAYWMEPNFGALPAATRRRDSHKGDYGSVLVIGGDLGMAGAVSLAGIAALRCGVGKVRIATRPEHVGIAASTYPELMVHAVSAADELENLLPGTDAVIVGPGLGQSEWSHALLAKVLQWDLPKVVDADALTLLSQDPVYDSQWVLTPHPGEARALSGRNDVQRQRYATAADIVEKYGGVCVLKGAGTLVCSEKETRVCTGGNPGMATAGMGDVLSGVIAALITQSMPLLDAASVAVCLHARAGDRAANDGLVGMIASDLMPYLRVEMG